MGAKSTGLDAVWKLRLEEVGQALEANDFKVSIFSAFSEAAEYFAQTILPEINPGSAGVGGSETIKDTGIYAAISKYPGITFHNPYAAGLTPEQAWEARRQGLLTDLFVASTNALLRDGRLLNLDGAGNRIAGMAFGPKNLVLFVGRNKICEDIEAARQRIKEIAAPANAIRLDKKTPCAKTGSCGECKSPGRICSAWLLTEKSFPPRRIHVLLIDEDLGF